MPNLDVLFFFYFNPRSLTGAKARSSSAPAPTVFQSTLPYGSEVLRGAVITSALFQSTLPYGSEHSNTNSIVIRYQFQSTLPYGSEQQY